MTLRHLTKVSDFTREECEAIIDYAIKMKADLWNEKYTTKLKNKTLLMIFAKPSLRTRVSFETGMTQLGGHAIFYSIKDSPLGIKETIQDTTKCASRYVDMISARVFKRKDIQDIAANSDVPVINMLDDFAHPCQIMCDFQTIKEKKGKFDNLKMSFYGDCYNNVTYDLMRMCAMFGMDLDVACPDDPKYAPEQEVIDECEEIAKKTGAKIRVVHNALEAAKNSDILYADSWMSYGIPKDEEEERVKTFMPYQVNAEVMAAAKSDAIFMNCLPAKRGYEETAEVIDGPQSIVFDQAENRLHAQKAIMLFLLGIMD
ncbi:Ornithine carbamoyltransferase, anabolic [Candidatus Lokiarchaeum ossiferum]|uniref:Ornithine carbamoyltransferase n=1 Tax=Candidatus Lokiarchaeum ossiferum TaxID=2951803 RepID=A0ABY6HXZ8_9ARCH|nr:Ornithine carbamoyltransferase, anabolic [Candidatus Lokiarchaeum sp. B-35]